MDISSLKTFDFLFSLGYVTLGSSVITMILVEIIKIILKGTKVINKDTNAIKKDILLSRIGRVVALISYASLYVVDVLVIKRSEILLDISLLTSLISGSALTLCISKGIYTGLRQMSKKKTVYEKLEVAEQTIKDLENEIKELGIDVEDTKDTSNNIEKNENDNKKKKWVIRG